MEIKLNIDIEGIVQNALALERIQPLIDKAVIDAFKSAIDEATGYRSDFRKKVTEQLAEALPHGLHITDVAKFQQVLNAAVASAVSGANADTIRAAFDKVASVATPDVPARIKLSEFMKEARDGFHKEQHEAFFAEYRPCDYGGGGWLYLDSNEDCRSKYSARYNLAINESGEVYAMKLDGEIIKPHSMPDVISRFDGLLLSMYVGRTTIEVDIDSDDVKSAARDQTEY